MRKQRENTRHRSRPTMRLLVGDEVEVILGKDRGQRGHITEVIPNENRLRVSGLAIQTVHQRPGGRSRAMQQQAGRMQLPGKIDASNVMLVCPSCGERVRPRRERDEGMARRICSNCGAAITRREAEE